MRSVRAGVMTCDFPAHGNLIRDVGRLKDRLREKEDLLGRAGKVVEQQEVLLREHRCREIALHVADRLVRFEYFLDFVGLENVLDAQGRIDFDEVDVRVEALLIQRPELGAPPRNVGRKG